jgi:hypothetical protein
MTEKCIYSYHSLNSNVPQDDCSATLEHIVPYALGGSDAFTTTDASKKYNNHFGTIIDAPFMNLLPLAIKRHEFAIPGQSGGIPPIILQGRSEDNGEALTVEISADGNMSIKFPPTVIDDKKLTHLDRIVGGSPDQVRSMLVGMLRKAEKSGKGIYMKDGTKISTIDDFEAFFEAEETSRINASVKLDLDVWVRGIFKVTLGLGHVVLGPEWTFSSSGGDKIRTVLVTSREQWPQLTRGFVSGTIPQGIADALGMTAAVKAAGYHTVAVVPTEGAYFGVVSLFGGAVPEALVPLGPMQGQSKLVITNGRMNPRDRIGVRIDPRTRQTTWISLGDLATAVE